MTISRHGPAADAEPLSPRRAVPTRHHRVSVIIPTVLRPSLARAVAGARRQQGSAEIEVVVVVDRAEADCTQAELAPLDGADRVVFTGGGARGGRARNLGVQQATGDVVAFLDDDDEWLPAKTRLQLEQWTALGGCGWVIGARAVERLELSWTLSARVPENLIGQGSRIEDYLFLRRRAAVGRASFFTSCVLTDRATAAAVPWSETLPRHQDWDWLLRAQQAGARFGQHPDVAMVYRIGSPGSVSAGADWRTSLAWAERWRRHWSPQTYVDFVAGQPLRYAVQGRSAAGIVQCLSRIAHATRVPSAGPMVMAVGSVVPRPVVEQFLVTGRLGRRS